MQETNKSKNEIKILHDTDRKGKVINWRWHKLNSKRLAESYMRLDLDKRAANVSYCGDFLFFTASDSGEKNLKSMFSCKIPLCPMCSWRRSLKIFGQVSKVMNHIDDHYNYAYLFLTLTVKSVYGEELLKTLDETLAGFKLLGNRKDFKNLSKGWFRALEITYDRNEYITSDMWNGNKKKHMKPRAENYLKLGLKVGDRNPNYNKYHPHIHMIIAVNQSYFTGEQYLNHAEWTDMWRSCMHLNYDPIVDIRRFKESPKGRGKEVAETAKYTVKASDIFPPIPKYASEEQINEINKKTDDIVWTLDRALHRRRLIAFGGILKQVHKSLNLDNPEDGDLVNTDNQEELRDDINHVIECYYWDIGIKNYVLVKDSSDVEEIYQIVTQTNMTYV